MTSDLLTGLGGRNQVLVWDGVAADSVVPVVAALEHGNQMKDREERDHRVGKIANGQAVRAGGSRASPVALARRKSATPSAVKA
jgi:hypothetical protein